jgi:serine/threonine protein kinase
MDANITSPTSSRMPISSRIPADFNDQLPQYEIKVIDFGSSCFENQRLYTYVQSRFYRAPEVILGLPYDMAIDMWSLGCVLAELYTGYPLFPGGKESEQLICIMEVLGVPESHIIARGSRSSNFFGIFLLKVDSTGSPIDLVDSKGRKRRPGSKSLSSLINCADMAFIDFLSKCFVWDPEQRLKPAAAKSHPFVTNTRFIPNPVSHRSPAQKPESVTSKSPKKQLVHNQYASTSSIPASSDSSYRLRDPKSLESFKNRLPLVPTLTKFGARLSTAVGISHENAKSMFRKTNKAPKRSSLPPINFAGSTNIADKDKPATATPSSKKNVIHYSRSSFPLGDD